MLGQLVQCDREDFLRLPRDACRDTSHDASQYSIGIIRSYDTRFVGEVQPEPSMNSGELLQDLTRRAQSANSMT